MRKMLSLVLCMLLILSLSASALAATITPPANGTFAAYKLMDVQHDAQKNIYNYSITEKYNAILETATGKTTDVEILDYLLQFKGDDPNGTKAVAMREFADNVYAAIGSSIAPDYTSAQFNNVAPGYYLVVETQPGAHPDTVSLAMLLTAVDGATNALNTKESYPEVEKFVKELNDSEDPTNPNYDPWGKSANYDVGDTIEFKLEGTVSSLYGEYKNYYYSFVDTMDDKLELTGTTANNTFTPSGMKIMIGSVDVTSQFHIVATKNSFTATADLKALTGVTITAGSEIIMTYTATLTNAAVAGVNYKNEVYLVYQNDPYDNPDPENPDDPDDPDDPNDPPAPPEHPGQTPKDTVVVITFKTIVNKVTGTGTALPGAGFTLYKWDLSVSGNDKWKEIKKLHDDAGNTTSFNFTGMDAGIYKLVETKIPAGYNQAEDVLFSIVVKNDGSLSVYDVTMNENTNQPEVNRNATSTKFTVTNEPGAVSTNVVNNFGQKLPETGGTGTTVLYVVGSVLVLAAVVLLVTKKRMGSAE